MFGLYNLYHPKPEARLKATKRKPNRVGANKHQASKKGFKHKHNQSHGQKASMEYHNGKLKITGLI